ncbi:MAG: hypothetical protein HYV07_13865 [Deltaproteobacteria bacterium]|nr:hypothetical protein [Deltaproteobacteria bacterium]
MRRWVGALALIAALGLAAALWVAKQRPVDLEGCPSCEMEAWRTSAHSRMSCGSCHPSSAGSSLAWISATVLGTKRRQGKPEPVREESCRACHESPGADRFRAVLETAGHRAHVGKELVPGKQFRGVHAAPDGKSRTVECLDCHQAHEAAPAGEPCLKCHDKVVLHESKMSELECLDCHDFLAPSPDEQLRPGAGACRKCHSESAPPHTSDGRVISHQAQVGTATMAWTMKDWLADDNAKLAKVFNRVRTSSSAPLPSNGVTAFIPEEWVHGGVDCRMCHNPHEDEAAKRRSGKLCQRCHKRSQLWTEEGRPEEHRRCPSCHAGHAERGFPQKNCQRCHEDKHASLHPKSCTNCHEQHTWKASGRDCGSCHADKAIELFDTAPLKHDPCTNCHDPHEGRKPGEACATCHKDKGATVRVSSAERHRQCVGCHTPHGPKPIGSEVCGSCHEDQARGSEAAASHPPKGVALVDAPHAKCRDCHRTTHGSPERDSGTCRSCHQEQFDGARVNKAPPKHQECLSCHVPHQQKIRPTAAACGKCHERQSRPDYVGAHQGDCLKCHPPHRSFEDPPTKCANCHKEIQPKASPRADKHRDCRNCHLPHRTRAQAKERCATCHQQQLAKLTAWTAIPDHLQCASSCHEGHDVTKLRDCRRCHERQATAAGKSKHDQCQKCHNPHEMKDLGPAAKWADCGRCHGDKAKAIASRGPTHSSCAKCHRPHRFERPRCDSCHTAIADEGVHRVEKHQECPDCHDTHHGKKPGRPECVKCHEAQTNHFPDAKACQACHPFAAGVEPPPGMIPASRGPAPKRAVEPPEAE